MWPPAIISWITVILATAAASDQYFQDWKYCCLDRDMPLVGRNCTDGLQMNITCSSSFILLREPFHFTIVNNHSVFISHQEYDIQQFIHPEQLCMGVVHDDNGHHTNVTAICISAMFDDDYSMSDRNVYLKLYSYFLLVSVVFLAATLVVYCCIPSLRDLQGRCLMCFVTCLAIGYFSLAILQQNFFDYNVSNTICTAFGFWTYFWLLCAFFWLSLIAFNIWYQSRYITVKDGTLWIMYLLFGFGIPTLFQIGAILSHHIPKGLLNPNIGNGVCWFQGITETWIYFSGPVAILLFSNLMFFIMTTRILWIHYREVRPQPRIRTLRFKTVLYLKLFLTMGLTWIFELISFTFQIDWYVSDILNSLQGPIIFVLMVLTRKKVIRRLTRGECCVSCCYLCSRACTGPDHDDENETEALEDIQLH